MSYSQLVGEEFKAFPQVVNPAYLKLSTSLSEFEGYQKVVMLDRYSYKDGKLRTLKEGDLVVVEVKPDPEYPTQGYGRVTSIGDKTISVRVEYPESVSNADGSLIDLDNVIVTRDKVSKPLEIYWEQIAYRVARAAANEEKTRELRRYWFKKFFWMLKNKYAIPGGRILFGAGSNIDVTLFNCFVLNYIKDSRRGIARHRETTMEIMSRSGGVGSNGSTLRPRDAYVSGVNGKSSGADSWLNDLSRLTDLVQQGGSRRGAQMLGLADWHPDLIRFILCKIQNPYVLDKITKEISDSYIVSVAESFLVRDDKGAPVGVHDTDFMTGANISVLVSHDLMQAVEANEDWVLRFPDNENFTAEQKEYYDNEWHNIGDIRKWEAQGLPVKEYYTMPATQVWDLINLAARYSAEPGVIFIDQCNDMSNAWYYAPLVVTNPCFTGDMRLLTSDGYKTFEELDGQDVKLINYKGNTTEGRVWKTGEKPTVKVRFWDKHEVECTEDHRFMLLDGSECQAKDLKDKVVMPYLKHTPETENEFVKYGFIQGDGNLSRIGTHRLLGFEVNFGKKDEEVRQYFGLSGEGRKEYVVGYNDILNSLGFSNKTLPERVLPSTFDTWSFEQKRAFLKGLFSANGSVVSKTRVSFKTTCHSLVLELQRVLKEVFDIDSNITTNKPKDVDFPNGTYTCRQSYDLHVSKFRSLVSFNNTIGFIHTYKMDALKEALLNKAPKVKSVISTEEVKSVYDFHEPETHWGVVEGVVVHNCGEQPLPANGVCNLIAIVLANMSDRENQQVDYDLLKEVVHVSQRFSDNIIDHSFYFMEDNEKMAKGERRIGKGVMGLADLMIDLKLPYGSEEMLAETDKIFECIKIESYRASANIAQEKGSFPYYNEEKLLQSGFMKTMPEDVIAEIKQKGLRNVCSLTIAPTGTTGTMMGVATSFEPYYAFTFFRTGRLGKFVEQRTAIAERYFAENPDATELPKYFVSSQQIPALDHVKVQSVVQKHVDSSISKTCNAPKDFTVEQNKELYMTAWKLGCKGVTVYVDGSRSKQVLSTEATENEFSSEDNEASVVLNSPTLEDLTDEALTGDTRVCSISFDEAGNLVKECS